MGQPFPEESGPSPDPLLVSRCITGEIWASAPNHRAGACFPAGYTPALAPGVFLAHARLHTLYQQKAPHPSSSGTRNLRFPLLRRLCAWPGRQPACLFGCAALRYRHRWLGLRRVGRMSQVDGNGGKHVCRLATWIPTLEAGDEDLDAHSGNESELLGSSCCYDMWVR